MDNQQNISVPLPSKDIEPIVKRIYTEITNASCDCRIVRILKQLLSGRVSEMTGINTYLFQSFISNRQNPALSLLLREILMQDLTHMELLGRAIFDFGGIPKFSNGQGNFWSGRMVNYNTESNNFVRSNIEREERLIREYENAILRINNESLRQLLREIVEDKRENILKLENYLNNR